jgi:LacI family transcriptional regulator
VTVRARIGYLTIDGDYVTVCIQSGGHPVEQREATQRDIARRLGIGQITVSRAVRGEKGVKKETRERILAAARELGYKANISARAMRTGRLGTVALLQDTSTSPSTLQPDLLRGIHDALAERNMRLMMERVPEREVLRDGGVPRVLREWMADGLLVNHNPKLPHELTAVVRKHRVPAVWINSKRSADCVRPDDREAARRATELLVEKGHRRITFADYSSGARTERPHYSPTARQAGYMEAMEKAGLRPKVIRGRDYIPRRERVSFSREWLRRRDHPTAVLTLSASTASPIFLAARLMGLEVPASLSIISIDDRQDDLLGTATSCMVIPWREIGRAAVEMLVEKIERPSRRLRPQVLEMVWQEGDTFGPPAAAG